MQVKKFEAPTMSEAVKIIKTELGPDAIILSTKKHRKGFGLLSKGSVEVTAAISDRSYAKKRITEKVVPQETSDKIKTLPAEKQAEVYEGFNEFFQRRRERKQNKAKKEVKATNNAGAAQRYVDIEDSPQKQSKLGAFFSGYKRNGASTEAAPSNATSGTGAVANPGMIANSGALTQALTQSVNASSFKPKNYNHLEETIKALNEDVKHLKTMIEEVKGEQTAVADSQIADTTTDELRAEFQSLLRNGLDKKYATKLLKEVLFEIPKDELGHTEKVIDALAIELMSGVKVEEIMDFHSGEEKRMYALVGPTGVGKTTTIAKLASKGVLEKGLKVGVINIDTYKVGATDQLQTYAKILNIPFRQASTQKELDRAIAEFKPLDLVLIDTTGRSQKDSEGLSTIRNLVTTHEDIRAVLIMSATTRDQELYDIVTRFKVFSPQGLIFSKLDEASVYGCIYNLAQKTGLPLSYFTVGQRVPEDIEVATKERVAALILDL